AGPVPVLVGRLTRRARADAVRAAAAGDRGRARRRAAGRPPPGGHRPRRRRRARARRPRRPDQGGGARPGHRPRRRRDRRRRTHRLRRADRPAPRAARRPRVDPVADDLHDAARADPAARLRHRGAGAAAHRRGAGRRRHRVPRRPRADLGRPPVRGGAAVSALVLRAGRVSALVERRTAAASLALAAAALLLAFAALCRGDAWDPPGEVLAALAGHGDAALIVQEWRLPRVTAALVFGAALGAAGAVFQNVTRNALGSPDVIGLDAGAYTGVLIVITVFGGSAGGLAAGSLTGGLAAAAAVYALSLRSGLSGMRLVVIGIAVNAMLAAVNNWIVLRAELEVAIAATGWSAGSLNGLDWGELRVPFLVVAALGLLLAVLARPMAQAALGDDLAAASGVALNR